MHSPVMRSDAPLAYTSAVSMKLTPASHACATIVARAGRVGAVAEHHRAEAQR
jgi:hypothetical protein